MDACNKAISFLVLCDSFNIPLVFLVDQPGFLIGIEGEARRAASGADHELDERDLAGHRAQDLSDHAQELWPGLPEHGRRQELRRSAGLASADLGFMAPGVGANVLFGVNEQDDPERYRELVAQLSEDTSAWGWPRCTKRMR